MANVGMPSSPASAAATSSWVLSGFEAHRAMSAPAAFSAIIKLAVSVVTCRHAPSRSRASGFSRLKRSRMLRRTGIWPSAQRMRASPCSINDMSFTSCADVALAVVISGHSPLSNRGLGQGFEGGALAQSLEALLDGLAPHREQPVDPEVLDGEARDDTPEDHRSLDPRPADVDGLRQVAHHPASQCVTGPGR